MSDPPVPAPRSQVKLWGAVSNPRYSVAVADGATDEELSLLVEQAVRTFHLISERLAVARVHGSSSMGEPG